MSSARRYDLALFPHVEYHARALKNLLHALEKHGIRGLFVLPHPGYGGDAVRKFFEQHNIPNVPFDEFLSGSLEVRAILTMNDWAENYRPLVWAAKRLDLATIALVEGVQDYDDRDVMGRRNAYKNSEYVLLPGEFDRKYFRFFDQNKTYVVGLSRFDQLWQKRNTLHFPDKPTATINVNFTYGVLEDHRSAWVEMAVEGCRRAGFDFVLSHHPADAGNFPDYPRSSANLYDLIEKNTVLISRFSTAILEAMIMGKAPVYLNPGFEKCDKFFKPLGAYDRVKNADELSEALLKLKKARDLPLDRFSRFLSLHCAFEAGTEPRFGEKNAACLAELIKPYAFPGEKVRELKDLYDHYLGSPPKLDESSLWRRIWRRTDAKLRAIFT